MKRVFAVVGLVFGLTATAAMTNGAAAQIACGERVQMLESFAQTYKEVPTAIGLTDRGGLIEVLVGPSGSWTMLLTMPGGPACIIGTGQDWHMRPAPGSDKLA